MKHTTHNIAYLFMAMALCACHSSADNNNATGAAPDKVEADTPADEPSAPTDEPMTHSAGMGVVKASHRTYVYSKEALPVVEAHVAEGRRVSRGQL